MRQVHAFVNAPKSKDASAINRFMIEIQLVEEFKWLPQDIAKIPYKWLQKYYIVKKYKHEFEELKQELSRAKKEL